MNGRALSINVCVIGTVCALAAAGPLASDPNALFYDGTLWRGSVVFDSGAGELQATVDYCIYAPGKFSYPGSGYTPTPGEFVYAYQIYSTGWKVPVITFTLAMLESNEANNIGDFDMGTGGAATNNAWWDDPNSPMTANWDWNPGMPNGVHSKGLAYSSINAPLWWIGTVTDGGYLDSQFVPSPSDVIPEPTALALLALGGAKLLRRRKH